MSRPCRSLRVDTRDVRSAVVVLAAILCGSFASAQAVAQPRDRVDGTLPGLQAPRHGERTVGTRALREAGEARFRDELVRQAELEALFNPHRAAWGGASMPIHPAVLPPYGAALGVPPPVVVAPYQDAKVPLPCAPGGCGPLKPSPRPPGVGSHDGQGAWGLRHRGP